MSCPQYWMKRALRVALLAAALARVPAASAADEIVSFNNQIGPILSEHCFHCHGPDSAARKLNHIYKKTTPPPPPPHLFFFVPRPGFRRAQAQETPPSA